MVLQVSVVTFHLMEAQAMIVDGSKSFILGYLTYYKAKLMVRCQIYLTVIDMGYFLDGFEECSTSFSKRCVRYIFCCSVESHY